MDVQLYIVFCLVLLVVQYRFQPVSKTVDVEAIEAKTSLHFPLAIGMSRPRQTH